jgi:two-component system nitrate/nitrite response regulator NarL
VRMLVVTEIRLYREGVAAALRALPDVELAVEAQDAAEAVVSARSHELDVVLLDMTLDDTAGLIRSLLVARPKAHVVALGVPEDGPEVVACAEAGISGYVSREASLDDLAEALRCTLRGEAPCPARVAAGLLDHIARQARLRSAVTSTTQLTPREAEVLRLLETGLTNKQIARSLDLQVSTVKNHVHHILAKFGAGARSELARAHHGS